MKLNYISNYSPHKPKDFRNRMSIALLQAERHRINPNQYLHLISALHAIHKKTDADKELPANFHKMHLSAEEGLNHALGEKFLKPLFQMMDKYGDFKPGMKAVIPFGGPGSMAVYLSQKGIPSISGDINYKEGTLYGTSEQRLASLKKNPYANADLIELQYWDATKLPLGDKSQDLMIINPPYGIECKLFNNKKERPEALLLNSLKEAKRVLKDSAVAYLFWPSDYMKDILEIRKDFDLKEEIIQGNNLRLSLVRLKKHE